MNDGKTIVSEMNGLSVNQKQSKKKAPAASTGALEVSD